MLFYILQKYSSASPRPLPDTLSATHYLVVGWVFITFMLTSVTLCTICDQNNLNLSCKLIWLITLHCINFLVVCRAWWLWLWVVVGGLQVVVVGGCMSWIRGGMVVSGGGV